MQVQPSTKSELYPIKVNKFERFSKKNFVECKLSPRLVSLSLQLKFHPSFLQQTPVKPSKFIFYKKSTWIWVDHEDSCFKKATFYALFFFACSLYKLTES